VDKDNGTVKKFQTKAKNPATACSSSSLSPFRTNKSMETEMKTKRRMYFEWFCGKTQRINVKKIHFV